jgi:hypothetical protein
MRCRKIVLGALVLLCFIALSGCIPGDGKHIANGPAGFLWGIWHGWIAPISLIMGLFDSRLRVYETVNTGWWYDFGFYMAIIGGFGGLSLIRKRNKKEKE